MNVSSWSIKNPIPAILLFILLSFAGIFAFRAMKIQQFMDLDLPIITVTALLPGASPSQMETEVARKIENAVSTLQGIKHIYTKMQDGFALVSLKFRLEKSPQEALDDVRDAISRIRSDLPADLRDPIISRINLSGAPILTYTLSSKEKDEEAVSWFIDNTVTKTLLSVKGVGAVARVGGVTREIQIELIPERLLALQTTASDISRRLKQVQQEASGGRTDISGQAQSVRTLAKVSSAEALKALKIALSDGRVIRLSDVAEVKDSVQEKRSTALLNGKPVVGFEITRSVGAGEIDVATGVKAALQTLQTAHPDLQIEEAFNFVDPVSENYQGSMYLLWEGALLAILVVWLFLRDARATLISATALPLSIIPTFAIMYLMGFSLNVVTLLSMSLVVGILVDDAIVEIENIMRHLASGKSPYQAAMEAADEIGLAVIATTFTLIAVFLPTAFMSGIVGKFFVQFGWTAAIAVFFSLVVARLLTPMMAAYLLKPILHPKKPLRWLAVYEKYAVWCLAHRKKTLFFAALFFVGSFLIVPFLPAGFMPPDDLSQTQIAIELPPGTPFEESFRTAEIARSVAAENPFVQQVYSAIGGGAAGGNSFEPPSASEARKATLTLNLKHRSERGGTSKQAIETELRAALRDKLVGARFTVGLGQSSEKYVLALKSDDGELLKAHAKLLERDLRTLTGVGNIVSRASLSRPEVIVRPDFDKMAEAGVTSAQLADTLRIATDGDYEQGLAKLDFSDRQVPIVVKLPKSAREDLSLLETLSVQGKDGPIRIGNLAAFSLEAGPSQIERYDRMRNINFEIELSGKPMGDLEKEILALPSLQHLPAGVFQSAVGDAEAMSELFSGFLLAMATGILCIYMVLVLLFHNFVQPVTILAALILSIPGAFVALFVTQSSLSMPSMIGMIMLMGIATKNSILLVDYIIIARRDYGLSPYDALLDACKKRARPIVMTTLAMGAGMMPIALGIGVDPSFRAPMAIVVIGGLVTSTFLSLLVIPVVFSLTDEFFSRITRQFQKRL